MSQGDTTLTVVGNLTDDLELRFTPSGAAVANGTIASTPRIFDKNTNEWVDGETLFMRFSIWREAAENASESLMKGMRVIAVGKLKQRSYDTKEGEKRTVMEMELEELGPSVKYATAKVTKASRSGGGGFGGGQQGGGQARPQGRPQARPQGRPQGGNQRRPSTSTQTATADQVWGQGSGGSYDWGQGQEDEPPF